MSLFKPGKTIDRRKIIEQILKDLDPGIRDEARRFLNTLRDEDLVDRVKVSSLLKKKGLLK
ncbi:hypothetical protein Smar_1456 [Staphylothermus marinus F1]|uniref:Uncharacterized protein n=1 Tax=Staphylothermus marinus (strain ATCC 43588 / DSM 3639 / JCM 9404 / F1) TaxID=399550 RepID=A3DPI6_STAMF|nr:hypothetical protein [Staphylothermus marinus]ABN70546.1 hypothetical protein Smar_1456 [Staphylothermus marinus F1]